jgi:hypothetical protein
MQCGSISKQLVSIWLLLSEVLPHRGSQPSAAGVFAVPSAARLHLPAQVAPQTAAPKHSAPSMHPPAVPAAAQHLSCTEHAYPMQPCMSALSPSHMRSCLWRHKAECWLGKARTLDSAHRSRHLPCAPYSRPGSDADGALQCLFRGCRQRRRLLAAAHRADALRSVCGSAGKRGEEAAPLARSWPCAPQAFRS